jgi:hypothetical protein
MNALLICGSPILEAECQLYIADNSKLGDERYFFFIINGEADLTIAQIDIQT